MEPPYEPEQQIAVYFSNGKRAIFKVTDFLMYPGPELFRDSSVFYSQLRVGTAIINWDNVCFCRLIKDDEEE